MSLRWLWLDHFPAGLELPAQQRLDAKRRAREHRRQERNFAGAHRKARRILWVCIPALTIIFLAWWLRPLWSSWKPVGIANVILGALSPLVFNGLLWTLIAYSINRSNAPFIRRALCEMGMPVCIDCGYILKGLPEDLARCPECGANREAMPDRS